jgi:hypothetical protein
VHVIVLGFARDGVLQDQDSCGARLAAATKAGHSSGAKSLTDRVLGALRSNALLNESPGAGYLERRWPEAFKTSGAWPLKSPRQAFLDGSLDRVINPDEYLKRKIPEFVDRGEFGLASGDLPRGGFERIWFREPELISSDEVSFDAGVYLIKRDRGPMHCASVAAHQQIALNPKGPRQTPSRRNPSSNVRLKSPLAPRSPALKHFC